MSDNQNLIKIFQYALNQEETGKNFFQTSLQRMAWGAAVEAFARLIKEEENHILLIKEILKSLERGALDQLHIVKNQEMEKTNFFDERARSEFLEQCIRESMVPDVTVFNTAWLIEKDLSEFYARMSEKIEGKPGEALKMLARWEQDHEKFFRQFRDELTDTYSRMPWGG